LLAPLQPKAKGMADAGVYELSGPAGLTRRCLLRAHFPMAYYAYDAPLSAPWPRKRMLEVWRDRYCPPGRFASLPATAPEPYGTTRPTGRGCSSIAHGSNQVSIPPALRDSCATAV
jgi:hypothetical protein